MLNTYSNNILFIYKSIRMFNLFMYEPTQNQNSTNS